MRNFLYLDVDFLTSFIAQIENGLIEEMHVEEAESEQQEKSKLELSFKPKVKATTLFVEGELTGIFKNNPAKMTFGNANKNIYLKRRNDEIFNVFLDYMLCKKAFKDKENIQIGNYLKDEYCLNFVSFTRIESLFHDELIKNSYYSSEDILSFQTLDSLKKNLEILKTTIPHDTFLSGENIFIPIIEEHLRGNKEQIGFSFENNVTVVGRVKKQIGLTSDDQTNMTKALNEIQNTTFTTLQRLGFLDSAHSKPYIIFPIAVFCDTLI